MKYLHVCLLLSSLAGFVAHGEKPWDLNFGEGYTKWDEISGKKEKTIQLTGQKQDFNWRASVGSNFISLTAGNDTYVQQTSVWVKIKHPGGTTDVEYDWNIDLDGMLGGDFDSGSAVGTQIVKDDPNRTEVETFLWHTMPEWQMGPKIASSGTLIEGPINAHTIHPWDLPPEGLKVSYRLDLPSGDYFVGVFGFTLGGIGDGAGYTDMKVTFDFPVIPVVDIPPSIKIEIK